MSTESRCAEAVIDPETQYLQGHSELPLSASSLNPSWQAEPRFAPRVAAGGGGTRCGPSG